MINRKFIILSLPIISTLCFLTCFIPLSHSEDVYIAIRKGFGSPGSEGNPVIITLDNLKPAKGIQLEICDEGNYLSSRGCDSLDRASEFLCQTNNLRNGCTTVLLYSVGNLIEVGAGPIIAINYDVAEHAPSGQCISLRLNKKKSIVADENNKPFKITTEPGEFCFEGGGDETTTTTTTKTSNTTTTIPSTKTTSIGKIPDIRATTIPKTTIPEIPDTTRMTTPRTLTTPRTFTANTTTTIREPTTKTKESPEKITETPSETTTIPLSSPYQISISPLSVTLNSGEVVEFHANTVVDGKKVKGIYRWEIIPASTIGSTINENGLFTAGNNTSDFTTKEIVRVTDTLHENSEATVMVTISIKKPPPTGCELSISPSSATLFPGDPITFSAKNLGKRCAEGSYKWKILSKLDSHISKNGIYTAGNNESGDSAFDIVIVKDTINNISIDAMVTVLSKEKVAQATSDVIQKPQLKALSSKVLIIILVLIILTGIVLFLKFK